MRLRDVRVRVRRGAKLLDSVREGWREEVDVSDLDMSHGPRCILGQLYGEYVDGIGVLGLRESQAEKLGFLAKEYRDYPKFDRAWVEEVLRPLPISVVPSVPA